MLLLSFNTEFADALLTNNGNTGMLEQSAGISGGDWNDGSPPQFHEPMFAENQVLIKLSSNTVMRVMPDLGIAYSEMRFLNPANTTTDEIGLFTENSRSSSVYLLILDESEGAVKNALEILNANPAVEIAEPNFLYSLSTTPNDPLYNTQWALQKINAREAWNISTGSKNVVVGVIDTGIDGTHPDLIGNLWENPNPNQNGYIDDIHGYNFTGGVGGIPNDFNGHGTLVAGIIGASGNNGIGISGINWDVSLAWLGAFDGRRSISLSGAIEALNYANNNNIPIVNGSWGSSLYSQLLYEAIEGYTGLFVAAAGNSSSNNDVVPVYPACYNLPNIISVASVDFTDSLSAFSNSGENSIHIAAPGSNIISTYLGGTYLENSGTSMAAPHVAGVAALIRAVYLDYTTEQIRYTLLSASRPVDTLIGFGILDAHNALLYPTLKKHIYGDANGDGNVDLLDAMRIAQWYAGWIVDICEVCADVNGDGVVNLLDAMRIAQWFTGWDVVLGSPP
jgi:subtilisin family serine protease